LRYIFDNYSLDPDRRELRCGQNVVPVEPQVFDILLHLVRNRDCVVSSDDLIGAIWNGRFVSGSTVSSRLAAARRAISDTGEKQRLIATLPRRGHRFVGSVREEPTQNKESARNPQARTERSQPQNQNAIRKQAITFCKTKDGFNLAVSSVGKGPVLVRTTHWLSHVEYDWQSSITAPFLHSLASFSRLVRYDGRGVGLSDRNISVIAPETLQIDLETVVDALELQRFALLGTSQGAAIAFRYAAKHPERVSKIIVHGSYVLGRNRRGTSIDTEESQMMISMMRRGWGDENSAFMRAFVTLFLPNGTPEQIKAYADLQRFATSAENAVKIRMLIDETDVRDVLPKVQTPTLVFHSRYDNVVPFEQGRLVAASVPRAKFAPLESSNHVLLTHEPAFANFIYIMKGFLTDPS
jgi:DNA-binding winged helix-turn-helix (wHTH) protein/pimeloyl-ACP methyl ester carboxylesterase